MSTEKEQINKLISELNKSKDSLRLGIKTLADEQEEINKTLKTQTITYVLTILGIMMALSWKSVIETGISKFVKSHKDSLKTQLIFAGVISIIVIVIGYLIIKTTRTNIHKIKHIL